MHYAEIEVKSDKNRENTQALRGEWVLIEYSKPGDRLKVLGGEPIGYSYNEEEG